MMARGSCIASVINLFMIKYTASDLLGAEIFFFILLGYYCTLVSVLAGDVSFVMVNVGKWTRID